MSSSTITTRKCDVCNKCRKRKAFEIHLKSKTHLFAGGKVKCKIWNYVYDPINHDEYIKSFFCVSKKKVNCDVCKTIVTFFQNHNKIKHFNITIKFTRIYSSCNICKVYYKGSNATHESSKSRGEELDNH